jgi:hypothetical protein
MKHFRWRFSRIAWDKRPLPLTVVLLNKAEASRTLFVLTSSSVSQEESCSFEHILAKQPWYNIWIAIQINHYWIDVICTREVINAHYTAIGKPEEKRPLGRPRHRWEDNIITRLSDYRRVVDWQLDLLDTDSSWLQFTHHYYTQTSVLSHVAR